MTSRHYKIMDLERWNHLQLTVMKGLHLSAEPDEVLAFGEWFASLVDDLGRLPSWEEIRAFSPHSFSH